MSNKSRIHRYGIIFMFAAIITGMLVSCAGKDEARSMAWGSSTYYKDFLWKRYVPDTLTRQLVYEFNEDAVEYAAEPVTLGIFKKTETGKLIPVTSDEAEVYVNGQRIADNLIELSGPKGTLDIGIVLPDAETKGTYHWYLKPVYDGNLDRINDMSSEEFSASDSALMELAIKKNQGWNPLARLLVIILLVLLSALVLWLVFGKMIFYPTFKVKSISMTDPVPFFGHYRLSGARKLILTSKNRHQSLFNRIMTGKVQYGINPVWETDIVIIPRDRKSIRIQTIGKEYYIMTKVLKLHEEYTLEHTSGKGKTTIVIS